MRILFVNNRFPPFITGGYEMSAALVAQRLARRGHEVRVLVSAFGVTEARPDDPLSRVLHRVVDSPRPLDLLAFAWRDTLAVHDAVRSWRPDLISVWNMEGLFPGVLRALVQQPAPVVFHFHDLWLEPMVAWSRQWREFWTRPAHALPLEPLKRSIGALGRVAGLADGWPGQPDDVPVEHAIFCSEYQRRQHAEAGVFPRHSRVILSGTDVSRFQPAPRPAGSGLRALFVGRLVPEKGPVEAMRAVAKLVREGFDLRLTLAGAVPPDRAAVEEIDAGLQDPALGGRIRRLPMVANKLMAELYQDHDVLVFPTAHMEGLPRTVMEAMACGLAVVAAPTGGGAEILRHDDNALVVGARDAAGVEGALRRLFAEPGLVERLGRNARRHAEEHHSIDRTVAAIEASYREWVESGPEREAVVKTDQHNLVNVAQQRFVQSLEPAARRNPDFLAGEFLDPAVRERLRGRTVDELRTSPFYHYLLARTRLYDLAFLRALVGGSRHILILGAGADTRAYRFRDLCADCGATVTEADLPTPLREKSERARALGFVDAARYEPLDIAAPNIEGRIASLVDPRVATTVLIEGVSTHVPAEGFTRLLRALGSRLSPGSSLTFDASCAPTGQGLFRLAPGSATGATCAAECGFDQRAFWGPAELEARYLRYRPEAGFFSEDSILDWTRR